MPLGRAGKVEVRIDDVMRAMSYDVRIVGLNAYRWRWRVAQWILRLVAWIAGVGIQCDSSDKEKHEPDYAQ